MFDKKVDDILAKATERFRGEAVEIKYDVNMKVSEIQAIMLKEKRDVNKRLDELSYKMKIVIGISLGLSLADTILLFAILKKLD